MTVPRKVLVVDDHDEFRSNIADYINSEVGYDVVGEASNGEQAVKLATALAPDVVFMDLSMPVMSGIEAVHRIKQIFPAMKIVIVTIHDGPLYRTMAEFMHVDGFVCKNSLIADLRTALHNLR